MFRCNTLWNVSQFQIKILVGFYPLAMLQETADRLIYAATFHTVSGHTLKHLSAAMVPLILTVMLAKRSVYLERLAHVSNVETFKLLNFICYYSNLNFVHDHGLKLENHDLMWLMRSVCRQNRLKKQYFLVRT